MPLPGWLLKRAREGGFARAHEILRPATEHSAAVYLLLGTGLAELHAVDDATSGIDGVTIPLTAAEAGRMLAHFAGALTGRLPGTEILPLVVAP